VRKIGLIYDKENRPSDLSLSVLEYRIEKVETDERTVKALEKDAGDEKRQMTLDLVRRCKKLLDLVREWPRKQDDVKYFIDSMDNIVAILKLLCEDEDQWKIARVNALFCKTGTGWHKPPSFPQVNLI
jgi:hypothetical protein